MFGDKFKAVRSRLQMTDYIKAVLKAFLAGQVFWINYDIYTESELLGDKLERFYRYMELSLPAVVFCALSALFLLIDRYGVEKKKSIWLQLYEILFAFAMVAGYSLEKYKSFKMLHCDGIQLLKTVLLIIGWLLLMDLIVRIVQMLYFGRTERSTAVESWDKKRYFKYMGIMLLLWLPYIILSYPTLIAFDTANSILQALGQMEPTNQHPYSLVLLLKFFLFLGDIFADYNLGLFLFSIMQMILFSFALTYTLKLLSMAGTGHNVIVGLLVVYSIVPLFPVYAVTICKDSSYGISLLYFVCFLVKLTFFDDKWSIPLCVGLISSGFMMCATRHNGLYVIILTAPVFIRKYRKEWKRAVLIFAAVICLFSGYNQIIYRGLGVKKMNNRGLFSIVFQTTAVYLTDHGDDLSDSEKETLGLLLKDLDKIPERYDPQLSDPVKSKYNFPTVKDWKKIFPLWVRMFFRHPKDYIRAYASNYYGYFYIDYKDRVRPLYMVSFQEDLQEATGIKFLSERNAGLLKKYLKCWERLPLGNLSFSLGFWMWILLFAVVVSLNRKNTKAFMILTPLLLTCLTILASPVNGYFRYMVPVIICEPLVMVMCLKRVSHAETYDRQN